MKYKCTLLAVKNMENSVAFYREILGLRVISDYGANKTLTGGIALQTSDTWQDFIRTDRIVFGSNATELYFEEDDMDGFISKLKSVGDVKYVHKPVRHAWGQRVVRFYDPDGHIIEVGENLKAVAKRFYVGGMSVDEVAKRMDISVADARRLLRGLI